MAVTRTVLPRTGLVQSQHGLTQYEGDGDGNASLLDQHVYFDGVNALSFSATPAFNFAAADTCTITLTGNVTSSTTSNLSAGHVYRILIKQDGTGSRTFVWPSTVKGQSQLTAVNSGASTTSLYQFYSDGTNLWPLGPGLAGM